MLRISWYLMGQFVELRTLNHSCVLSPISLPILPTPLRPAGRRPPGMATSEPSQEWWRRPLAKCSQWRCALADYRDGAGISATSTSYPLSLPNINTSAARMVGNDRKGYAYSHPFVFFYSYSVVRWYLSYWRCVYADAHSVPTHAFFLWRCACFRKLEELL